MKLIAAIKADQPDIDVIKKILKEDPKAIHEVDEYSNTPLICAARKGYLEICELILEQEPKIDATDEEQQTALMRAAENGHKEVVELLLKYKSNIDFQNDIEETALILAIKNYHTDTAILLIEQGANLNLADSQHFTVLMHAIEQGNPEIVHTILTQEVPIEINAADTGGRTALIMAARSINHEIGNEIIKLLLEYEKVKVKIDPIDPQERNALHWCALSNNAVGADLLKKAGAKLSVVDRDGKTAWDLNPNMQHLLTLPEKPSL